MKKSARGFLLASDIDGTLITHDLKIPERNSKVLSEFMDDGGYFTIATGRSIDSVRFFMKMAKPNCMVIALNGAVLYDFSKEEIVWQVTMPESAREMVKEVLREFPDMGAEIHIGRDLYMINSSYESERHVDIEGLNVIRTTLDNVPSGWHKVLFAHYPPRMEELRRYMSGMDIPGCYCVSTCPMYYEILNKDANKGNALLSLADRLGISHENTCAIGDYYNDIEMIEAAGIGAYTENAPDELKQLADYISCTCTEGAVADFIEYILTKE